MKAKKRKKRKNAKRSTAVKKARRLIANRTARRLKAVSIRAEGGYSNPDEMRNRKHYPYELEDSKRGVSLQRGHSVFRDSEGRFLSQEALLKRETLGASTSR